MSQFSYRSRVYMVDRGIKFEVRRRDKYVDYERSLGGCDVVMITRNRDNGTSLDVHYARDVFSRFHDEYGVYWSRVLDYCSKSKRLAHGIKSMVRSKYGTIFGVGGGRSLKHDELVRLLDEQTEDVDTCSVCNASEFGVKRCSDCGAGRCPVCHRRFSHVCGAAVRPVVTVRYGNRVTSFYFDDNYNFVVLKSRSFEIFGDGGCMLHCGRVDGRVRLDVPLDSSAICRGLLTPGGRCSEWQSLVDGVYSLHVGVYSDGSLLEYSVIVKDVGDIPVEVYDPEVAVRMTLCPMPGLGCTYTILRRRLGDFISIRGYCGWLGCGDVIDGILGGPIDIRMPVFEDICSDSDMCSDDGAAGSFSSTDLSSECSWIIPELPLKCRED